MRNQARRTFKPVTIRALFALFLVQVALSFSACSKVDFSGKNDTTGGETGMTPTTPVTCVEEITVKTKLLFLVDMSGSNVENGCFSGTCYNGTDRYKSFRHGALQNFLSNYSSKQNFAWGFIGFKGNSATGFTSGLTNASGMQSALTNFFNNSTDSGDTPYRAAFSAARSWIASDKAAEADADTNYMVIMLSDGIPTDYSDLTSAGFSAQMKSDIQSIVAVKSGHVSVSSVYYGQSSGSAAINTLSSVASYGGGQFVNVNNVSNFKIEDVISPGTCH